MIHGGNVWRGGDPGQWLDFSANIRPGGAPEWLRAALHTAVEDAAYYPPENMAAERAALGRFLSLPGECVLPTAGGIAAIERVYDLPVRRVRLPKPAFAEYALLAEKRGLATESVPLLDDNGTLLPLTESLGAELKENTLLWLCNPSNPLGAVFSAGEVTGLLSAVEEKDGYLAVDEAFIDYCPENSVRHLIETHERLLITGSMTKILGIPGVRLGYLCTGEAMPALEKGQRPWELNCFARAAALSLPEHRDDVLSECARNRARRTALRAGLEALGVRVYPSEANFLLCDFGRDTQGLERYLSERKILVRSCRNFKGLCGERHLRLAVKDETANEILLKTLKEAMECAGNP